MANGAVTVKRHETEDGKAVWDVFVGPDWHERYESRKLARTAALALGMVPAPKPVEHAATVAEKKGFQYLGKSWGASFKCPACGGRTFQNLNFLGRRDMVCNGVKWAKVAR
jgi:hypothetical protein